MDPTLLAISMALAVSGCAIGTFSGLVPGIHVNTLAALLLASYPAIEGMLNLDPASSAIAVGCCIMAASVVHSFVDFVPSVFIGAPDAEDAVSVLPGHRLLLKGRGMEAVRAAAIGSLIGCSAAIVLSAPLQWMLMNGAGDVLDSMTPIVLIVASAVLIGGEFGKGNGPWGAALFLLSGVLGLGCMMLPIPVAGILGEGTVMMPLLTGLFGIPVMLSSSDGARRPRQTDRVKDPVGPVPGLRGVLMGTVAGWFPGMTATVGASISATVFPEGQPARFISTVASIGTVTSVLALVTLSVSGNGRSGTALVIGEIVGDGLDGFMSEAFVMLLLASAVASLMGYWITIGCGKLFSRLADRVRQRMLSRTILILLVVLTFLMNGPAGLFVLLCSTVVGLLPEMFGTGRVILCGCLIIPVLLFRFGVLRSLEFGRCLRHELGVVDYEPLVGTGSDLGLGVEDDDLEHEPPAVDLDELGLAGDVHPDGGGRGVGDVQVRADRARPLLEFGGDAPCRSPLDEGDHGGGGEHGERAAPQGHRGVVVRYLHGLGASDSDAEHGMPHHRLRLNLVYRTFLISKTLHRPPIAIFDIINAHDELDSISDNVGNRPSTSSDGPVLAQAV